VKLNEGTVADPLTTFWNPESIGLAETLVQGEAKEDWVRVWFLAMNMKVKVSPTLALTLGGSKVNPPLEPTMMVWFWAATSAGRTARAAATEKRILIIVEMKMFRGRMKKR